MAKVHFYLNFEGNCEEAFQFYETVFDTPNTGINRYGDIPDDPNLPPVPDEVKDKVLHISIQLNEHTMLMGADVVAGFGDKLVNGNSSYIMLDVDSADEAERYFSALTEEAKKIEMDLAETFFAELYASFQDKFGVFWMIHFEGNKKM